MLTRFLVHKVFGRAMIFALFCLAAFMPSLVSSRAEERRVEIRGMDMNGYGRIVLYTQQLPKSEVAIRNGILLWTFDRRLDLRVDKIPVELSAYIAGARLDPDGKTLRLALVQNVKFNLQDAGDDLYLDLLPKTWKAANPPVPEEIVRDLSRRVREAEGQLRAKAEALEQALEFEGGDGPELALVKISPVVAERVKIELDSSAFNIRLIGRYRFEKAKLAKVLPRNASLQDVQSNADGMTIRIAHDPKYKIRYHFDDTILVIEFHKNQSGLLDFDTQQDKQKYGEITGSIAGGDHPDAKDAGSPAKDQLGLIEENNRLILNLPVGADTPLALFQTDHMFNLVFRSTKHFDWGVIPSGQDKIFQSARSLDSGNVRGVALGFHKTLFPVVSKTPHGYQIALDETPNATLQSYDYLPLSDIRDEARLIVAMPEASDIIPVDDPETGALYYVVPSSNINLGMQSKTIFQEFHIEISMQGLAIRKLVDDLTLNADAGALIISRPGGLRGLTRDTSLSDAKLSATKSILRPQNYAVDRERDPLLTTRDFVERIIASDPASRFSLRMRLARHYASHEFYREAAASMKQAFAERVSIKPQPQDALEALIYETLAGDDEGTTTRLLSSDMISFPDASLMMAYHHARKGAMTEAVAAYRASGSVLASYPTMMVQRILPVLAEAAIEVQDVALSGNLVAALPPYVTDETRDLYRYVSARYLGLTGQTDEALGILEELINSPDRRVATRARLAVLRSDVTDAPDKLAARLAAYQGLQTVWRGDWVEAAIVMDLAKLSFQAGDWRRGFIAMQTINTSFSDYPGARALIDTATTQLESIFDGPNAHNMAAIDAVSLFMDFREFMPVGRRGDDVIRKLTEKLEELDLLPQAAELMRYQIDNRMEPPARNASAPRLAYLYLLDRRPQDALAILNDTRMNGIPDIVHRARLLLEARARAELGDHDGAFELIQSLEGEDVDRLRAEMTWRAKEWRKAAETSELVIGEAWQDNSLFDDDLASYAIRSAIGYTLAKDRISLDRIRGRFNQKFGDRPDAAAFRFLTAPTAKSSPFQSEYAIDVKSGNAIDGFMTYYRDHYLKPPSQQSNAATP